MFNPLQLIGLQVLLLLMHGGEASSKVWLKSGVNILKVQTSPGRIKYMMSGKRGSFFWRLSLELCVTLLELRREDRKKGLSTAWSEAIKKSLLTMFSWSSQCNPQNGQLRPVLYTVNKNRDICSLNQGCKKKNDIIPFLQPFGTSCSFILTHHLGRFLFWFIVWCPTTFVIGQKFEVLEFLVKKCPGQNSFFSCRCHLETFCFLFLHRADSSSMSLYLLTDSRLCCFLIDVNQLMNMQSD